MISIIKPVYLLEEQDHENMLFLLMFQSRLCPLIHDIHHKTDVPFRGTRSWTCVIFANVSSTFVPMFFVVNIVLTLQLQQTNSYYDKHERIECIHSKLCKRLLEVSYSTWNVAVLGDCGRYQLFISYFTKCISLLKVKLGQVWVNSNIAPNNYASL